MKTNGFLALCPIIPHGSAPLWCCCWLADVIQLFAAFVIEMALLEWLGLMDFQIKEISLKSAPVALSLSLLLQCACANWFWGALRLFRITRCARVFIRLTAFVTTRLEMRYRCFEESYSSVDERSITDCRDSAV